MASGETIPDLGPACFEGEDEMEVMKNLVSASQMVVNGSQDIFLGYDGGFSFHRDSIIGRSMRQH